jgi:hypothetical protein
VLHNKEMAAALKKTYLVACEEFGSD